MAGGNGNGNGMSQERGRAFARARRAREQEQGAPTERPPVTEFRRAPDGSEIHPEWTLDWKGQQGQFDTLVSLRHKPTGRILFQDVAFGEIVTRQITDPETGLVVWVPSPSYAKEWLQASGRRVTGNNKPRAPRDRGQMLAAIEEVDEKKERRKRLVVGGGLAVLAAAGVGYMGWRLWQTWSSPRDEE